MPLAAGYVKPLYLNPVYQRRRALGRGGYPWAFNPDITYDYSAGSCPVAERMYASELVLSPLVREPHSLRDMDDFADAIERVLDHAEEIARDAAHLDRPSARRARLHGLRRVDPSPAERTAGCGTGGGWLE